MNAHGKPDDSVAAPAPAPSTSDVVLCGRTDGPKTESGKPTRGLESEPLVRAPDAAWIAAADENVEPAALAREARLMRHLSLACRSTFVVAALLWLLATVFPPPRSRRPVLPAPAPRLAPGASSRPSGCVRSLKDNKLYGRAIVYDHHGRVMFRREAPQPSQDAPRELISTAGAPLKRR